MNTLSVDNEMTIYTAASMRQQFQDFLVSDDDLELDLAKVSEMDCAGLQLLILLKHEAAQANKSLRIVMHSPAVVNILELTNLTSVFGDPLLLVSTEREE